MLVSGLSASSTYVDAHRALEATRWELFATGDWSWVYRDPAGELAARLSPWDPAYERFVQICLANLDNPYIPRIEQEVHLARGGHLVVMDYLEAVSAREASHVVDVLAFRAEPTTRDRGLGELRDVVADASRRAAMEIPYWEGLDQNPLNVMKSRDGHLKVVDLFFVSGRRLADAILLDRDAPSRIARDQLLSFIEIPDFNRHSSRGNRLRVALRA